MYLWATRVINYGQNVYTGDNAKITTASSFFMLTSGFIKLQDEVLTRKFPVCSRKQLSLSVQSFFNGPKQDQLWEVGNN